MLTGSSLALLYREFRSSKLENENKRKTFDAVIWRSWLVQDEIIRHIKMELNRGVNPSVPITKQDTRIGGCRLAFFPLNFVQGRGLNSESSWKFDHFWTQPSPETASHNLGGLIHWYSSIQPSSMIWRFETVWGNCSFFKVQRQWNSYSFTLWLWEGRQDYSLHKLLYFLMVTRLIS